MPCIRLLRLAPVVLLGSTLALVACNSNSVSGSSQKTAGSATVAQKTPNAPTESSSSQTLPAAWLAKVKALQNQ